MNSEDPDQMSHSAASDLGLHCLSMSRKKDARLICVNMPHLCLSITILMDASEIILQIKDK